MTTHPTPLVSHARDHWWTLDFANAFVSPRVNSRAELVPSHGAPRRWLWDNIAFVNSERWLAKRRVDVTQCQHGKFLSLTLYFFVRYYKKYNIFLYWYTVITTLVEIRKTRNCVKTLHPPGVVEFTVYINTKNVLNLLNIISCNWTLFRLCWTFLFPVGNIWVLFTCKSMMKPASVF